MDKQRRPENAETGKQISATQARAGTTPHIVRYVLGISLLLAVLAMMVILFPAM